MKHEKREAVERTCSEAEDAARLNDTRKLFNITKQLGPKAAAPMITVLDNGVPCMDLEHEMEVRTKALVKLCEAEEIPLSNRPAPEVVKPSNELVLADLATISVCASCQT